MSSYSKPPNRDMEQKKEDEALWRMSNESRELFRRALSEAMDLKLQRFEEESKDMELPPPSKRHKIQMNRLFRERVGGSFLPFPEADTLYERVRSRLVLMLKINERRDRRMKRKQAKEKQRCN